MMAGKLEELEALQARQEAMLAGLQQEAMYPEIGGSVGDLERDALPAGTGDFSRVSSNEYNYKDPKAPGAATGRHAGPMAQELESIPGVVNEGPDGMKRVDTGRLSLANASATGENARELMQLRKRLDALSGATSEGKDPDDVLAAASGRGRR